MDRHLVFGGDGVVTESDEPMFDEAAADPALTARAIGYTLSR